METEHFVIHYPVTREYFAQRALTIAEEAHSRLVPYLNWVPQTKTHISVTDILDESNGWARTTPRNEIRLYAWPPEMNEELGFYDDWMRQLIYHEYAHILHTDTSKGFHTILNSIFGKFARNNAATPRWYTEGLAVYYETLLSHTGRLRHAIYRIMLRNAALSQKLPSLGALSNVPNAWPAANSSYLFGSSFIAYIAKTYGQHTLAEWNTEYGDDWIPYAMNRAALKIWSKSWDELYQDWQQTVYQEAKQALQEATSSASLTPLHLLTPSWRHERPQAIPHQTAISYVQNDGIHPRSIVKRDMVTGEETVLTPCRGRCEHTWTNDGNTLFFSYLQTQDGYKKSEKLYVMDMQERVPRLLPLSGRLRTFAIDGDYLYRVVQVNESVQIYRNTWPLTEDTLIYSGAPFEQIDEIAVSNGQLIASRFEPELQRGDIYQLENGTWIALTSDKSPDISPYWRHDGRIGYVSEASGELNLWSMAPDGSDKKRHSHLLNGIFHVSESRNGDIYYTTYTDEGMAIATLSAKDIQSSYSTAPSQSFGFIFSDIPTNSEVSSDLSSLPRSRAYRPWRWLWPQTWTPLAGLNITDGVRIGLSFSGSDFADHHAYAFSIEYLTRKNAVDFAFAYQWKSLLWDFAFSASLVQGTGQYYNTKSLTPYDYQQFLGDIIATRTWNLMNSSHQLNLGFHLEYVEALSNMSWPNTDPAASPPSLPSMGWMNALSAQWRWSNMIQSEKSMFSNDGYAVDILARVEGPWLGAESHSLIGQVTLNAAWTMPWLDAHIIQATASAGASWSENSTRQPFRISSNEGFSLNTTDVALHGYPVGLLQGHHFLYAKGSYSAPLWDQTLGYTTLPAGISKLGATLFAEWGYAWLTQRFNILHSKFSLGAKLHIDLIAGYRLPIRLTLGYAWGGAPQGGHHGFLILAL